jgi:hypothetical protein
VTEIKNQSQATTCLHSATFSFQSSTKDRKIIICLVRSSVQKRTLYQSMSASASASALLSSFLLRSRNAHRGTACLVFFPLPSDIKNPLATIKCLESHELSIYTLKLPHNRWHVSFDPVNQNEIGDCICLRLLPRLCTLSFVLKRGRRVLYVRFPESFQKTSEKSICLCLRLRVHPLQTRNLQERKRYRDISMLKPAYMPPMPPSSLLSKKAMWKSHVRPHQKLRMNKHLISNPA